MTDFPVSALLPETSNRSKYYIHSCSVGTAQLPIHSLCYVK